VGVSEEYEEKSNTEGDTPDTLIPSYFRPDPEKYYGVRDSLYSKCTYNDLVKPLEDTDPSNDSVSLSIAVLPDPISGKRIQLPDGNTTTAALTWAVAGEQDNGLVRNSASNYSWYQSTKDIFRITDTAFVINEGGDSSLDFRVEGDTVTSLLHTVSATDEVRIGYLTTGSVLFAGASGKINQDNSNFFWDDTNNRLGVGTSSPTCKLEARDTGGATQLRLSTSASFYTEFQFDGSDLYVNLPTGAGSSFVFSGVDSLTYVIQIRNLDTTSLNSSASVQMQVAGTGAGDPYLAFDILGGGAGWLMGADNSDSDKFKLSTSALSGFAGTKGIVVTTDIYTTFSPAVATSGTAYAVDLSGAINTGGANGLFRITNAASTGQTASTEINFINFDLGATTTWATGALTDQRAIFIEAPTLAFAGASTVTRATTLYIDRAPQAGTNATLTEAYALWVDAGTVRLDGDLHVYNTYTDGSNYERGVFRWSSNVLEIGTEETGTGSTRDVYFIIRQQATTSRWYFRYGSHAVWSVGPSEIRPEAGDSYDLGTSTFKVRDLWLQSTIFVGSSTSNEADSSTGIRLSNARYISGRNSTDAGDIGIIGVNSSNAIVIGPALSGAPTEVVPGADDTISLGSSSAKWSAGYFDLANVGTATDAAASGDLAAGLTGASRLFWDQSAALLALYNSTTATNLYASGGFLGINTSGPDRRLDVLDASNPQLRLTHTDGSVHTDFQTDSSGSLLITPTGVLVSQIGTSTEIIHRVDNLSSSSTARAAFQYRTGASANLWQTFARNGDLFFGIAAVADYVKVSSAGSTFVTGIRAVGSVTATLDAGVSLQLGEGAVAQGYIRLESAGGTSRQANIYSPAGGGLQIDTNSNAYPILLDGSKVQISSTCELDGALDHDGSTIGFYGVTPVARSSTYTITNVTTDRAYDANSTTLDEIADTLGTLIADLKLTGIIG
jgi:hypothetical protein